MTNYHGKLPWLLLVKPTPVGERPLCLMVAGLSLNDLEDRTEAIASTSIARDARVTRSKRFAPLVWIDVIRRDPLAASKPLVSVLLAKNHHLRPPAHRPQHAGPWAGCGSDSPGRTDTVRVHTGRRASPTQPHP